MNIYALAKLIESVKEVDSRKRLQKSLFLLQAAGCDLDAEYFLHFYGPYSREVANATDELEQAGAIHEEQHPTQWGVQYSYSITDHGRGLLVNHEKTAEGIEAKKAIASYIERFKTLNEVPLWTLELAATIAFYKVKSNFDWDTAKAKTGEFKQVQLDGSVLSEAEDLAKSFVPGTA